jgi:hypothetical protein
MFYFLIIHDDFGDNDDNLPLHITARFTLQEL